MATFARQLIFRTGRVVFRADVWWYGGGMSVGGRLWSWEQESCTAAQREYKEINERLHKAKDDLEREGSRLAPRRCACQCCPADAAMGACAHEYGQD